MSLPAPGFSRRSLVRCGGLLALTVALLAPAKASAETTPNLLVSRGGNVFYVANGQVYSIDTQLQRIERLQRQEAIARLQVDANRNIVGRGLAYDAKLDLYRPAVWQVVGGRESASPAPRDGRPQPDDFAYSDVADADGNLYFWQHDAKRGTSRIVMRARKGGLRLVAGQSAGHIDGTAAEAQLGQIGSMTVGPDGVLYFTDDQSVRKVDASGRVTTIARGGLLSLGAGRIAGNHLCSLTLAADGSLFVCDRVTRRILRVATNGTVTGYAYNTDDWMPVSASWAAGSLYVLEVRETTTRTVRYDATGHRYELVAAAGAGARPVGDTRPIWLG
jgi:hypothetical protein